MRNKTRNKKKCGIKCGIKNSRARIIGIRRNPGSSSFASFQQKISTQISGCGESRHRHRIFYAIIIIIINIKKKVAVLIRKGYCSYVQAIQRKEASPSYGCD